MSALPPFAQVRAGCQDPSATIPQRVRQGLAKVWTKNPSYLDGRHSKHRWRLETWMAHVYDVIGQYIRKVPTYAPFSSLADWPQIGFWLPDGLFLSKKEVRRVRSLLETIQVQYDQAMLWLRAWRASGGRPHDVVRTLQTLIGGIGRLPDG
jgi:hypothetical protein